MLNFPTFVLLFQTLLFNPSKLFSRGQNYMYQDMDLMIDCFVSCFRIQPHSNEALKVCLNLTSPWTYHFVLVRSLYRIVTQPRLHWWPQIDLVYSKSSELRAMFTDTLNKAIGSGYIAHTPLRMIQSLTLKGKDSQAKFKERAEEVPGYRNLLLYMVRLIHADPMLMLNVSIVHANKDMCFSTLHLLLYLPHVNVQGIPLMAIHFIVPKEILHCFILG